MGYTSDQIMMHIIATTHMENQVREQIKEHGIHVPQFDFNCQCAACRSLYKDKILMESILKSICKNLYKEMQGNN